MSTPRPSKCADGRLPYATPDALALANVKGLDLCAHQGQRRGLFEALCEDDTRGLLGGM